MTNEASIGTTGHTPPPLKLEFLADPAHGWLEVEMAQIRRLGIAQVISPYSYVSRDGLTAYLEEDCDAPRFVDACRKAGITLEVREHHCNGDSFIRRLPSWNGEGDVRTHRPPLGRSEWWMREQKTSEET